ncbi:TolC family protein [Inmirania thermothiophila]|uniref:Outer membrane protein TolC n=1 Tax=Inmirania thermothiophila TaxID=1750597 RepID=A0A3N1XU28_9GAMM|nr:TolC family protein [Inmirania thermothiophila]ROR29768.1 outer membrane protein TolC [Inmirania thermothiophila]
MRARRWMLALMLGPLAAAAQPVDFDVAVRRALEQDPRLAERRHLVEAARALLQEALGNGATRIEATAFLGLAPDVEGGPFEGGSFTCTSPCRLRDDGPLPDGVTPWLNLRLAIIKPLATFGKIERYAEAAQANVDVRRGDVRLEQGRIVTQVAHAYYGFLAARDTRRLLEQVGRLAEDAEVTVEKRLEEGASGVRQSDLYAVRNGKALIERFLAEARGLEAVAAEGLRVLAGLEGEVEVADRGLRPLPLPEGDLATLQRRALERRPEMAQLEAGLRARRALVEAARAERRPNLFAGLIGTLSVSGREDLENPFIVDPFNSAGLTPVVGVQWSWATGVQPARVARARAELDALVEKGAFARRGIPFQVAEAYHRARSLREAVAALERASRAGRRWMLGTFADFEAGLETSDRLVEAFKGYVLSHADYLATLHQYNLQVVALRQATGDLP